MTPKECADILKSYKDGGIELRDDMEQALSLALRIIELYPELVEALKEISCDGWSGDATRLRKIAVTADELLAKAKEMEEK